MTLKTDYLDGATGLTEKMQAAFDAGVAFVATNNIAIQANLLAAASAGKTSFTSTHQTSYETVNLRLEGRHMNTYFAGIIKGMSDEGFYSYEVAPSLDTSDTVDTFVILTFTL